jgi:hypothetical protein
MHDEAIIILNYKIAAREKFFRDAIRSSANGTFICKLFYQAL